MEVVFMLNGRYLKTLSISHIATRRNVVLDLIFSDQRKQIGFCRISYVSEYRDKAGSPKNHCLYVADVDESLISKFDWKANQ